jgi:ABC-type enterochelin transport system permease subunit
VKPSFWSRPFELSFKDVLAIIFSGTFLFFAWKALGSRDALAVVQALVPLVGIILGGYFVQESATVWFQHSQREVMRSADNRNQSEI